MAHDWDGTGFDEMGVYDPVARRFSFLSLAGAEVAPARVFGADGDLPVVGDWNGDGTDDIGAFRSSRHTFLWAVLTGVGGSRTLTPVTFGRARDLPVIGDWDGDGTDDHAFVTPA